MLVQEPWGLYRGTSTPERLKVTYSTTKGNEVLRCVHIGAMKAFARINGVEFGFSANNGAVSKLNAIQSDINRFVDTQISMPVLLDLSATKPRNANAEH